MASGIIGEGVMIVASVIVAGALAGVILNQVGVFESTTVQATDAQQEKILTKIKIVYATNSSDNDVNIYVKNTGQQPIVSLDNVDVYFGPINSAERYFYSEQTWQDNTWEFNDTSTPTTWQSMETQQIDINEDSLAKSTTYEVRVTTPNGIYDEYIFSIP